MHSKVCSRVAFISLVSASADTSPLNDTPPRVLHTICLIIPFALWCTLACPAGKLQLAHVSSTHCLHVQQPERTALFYGHSKHILQYNNYMFVCHTDIVSHWTWAATLLQSSNQAYQYGVSGPFWYAGGATIQIILFGILAVQIKMKAPSAHTVLEIVHARWGTVAHLVFFFFCFLTNIIVSAMLILGGAAVMTALTGMNTVAVRAPKPAPIDPLNTPQIPLDCIPACLCYSNL